VPLAGRQPFSRRPPQRMSGGRPGSACCAWPAWSPPCSGSGWAASSRPPRTASPPRRPRSRPRS